MVFLNIQIGWIILKTYDQQFTLTTKKSLHITFKVLHPTRHKTDHFRDVLQVNLLAWYGKTNPNTTKAHNHQSKEMYYNTK